MHVILYRMLSRGCSVYTPFIHFQLNDNKMKWNGAVVCEKKILSGNQKKETEKKKKPESVVRLGLARIKNHVIPIKFTF